MLNEKDVLNLIQKYANTPEGKAKIKEAMGGKAFKARYAEDVSPKKTKKQMMQIGEDMKQILFDHINGGSSKIIKSFKIDDIIVGHPVLMQDGRYKIEISFNEDALRRKSLDPQSYPNGIDNIVKLFVTGHKLPGAVKGVWEGHGEEEIWSRRNREPNDFMERAVQAFNDKYSEDVVCAELYDEYKR